MSKPKQILFITLIVVAALCLAALMSGCTSSRLFTQSNKTHADSTKVFNYDSAWKATVSDIKSGLVEKETQYKDSFIFLNGEPVLVPSKTIERHYYHNEVTKIDTGGVSRGDSTITHIDSETETKEKKKTGLPLWAWLAIGGGFCFIVLLVFVWFMVSRYLGPVKEVITQFKTKG